MSTTMNSKILKTEVTENYVKIILANGTELNICSNLGYIHIGISGNNIDHPIKVEKTAANHVEICYTPNSRN